MGCMPCEKGSGSQVDVAMAVIKLTSFWQSPPSSSQVVSGDSVRGREIIHEAHKKSGGPTKELKRIYGEYLEYKRARSAKGKD